MKQTLLITDSHISPGTPEETAFTGFLARVSALPCATGIVFMGDIFELWLGFPGYEDSVHGFFRSWCLTEKARGRYVGFIEGNHEFYLDRRWFSELSGDSISLDGGKLYITHGDRINRHDILFSLLRLALRNPFMRLLARLGGHGPGKYVSDRIRLSMKGANMRQKRYFPEHELEALGEQCRNAGAQVVAVGHFHRAWDRGTVHILPPWSPNSLSVGVYTHGTASLQMILPEAVTP